MFGDNNNCNNDNRVGLYGIEGNSVTTVLGGS